MSIVFAIYIFVVVAAVVVAAKLTLYGINRLYKIQGNSVGLSFLVVFLTLLATAAVSALAVQLTSSLALVNILGLLTWWIVAYFLSKRFFDAPVGKFLAASGTFYGLWIALTILVALPVRTYVLEPVSLLTDSMAPTFKKGQRLLFEKWDKTAHKGDVVLVSIPCPNGQGTCVGVRRVSAVPGDLANGTQVPSDAYYIAADSEPSKAVEVKTRAIVGKLFLTPGQPTAH
jgi:signal peptidase I